MDPAIAETMLPSTHGVHSPSGNRTTSKPTPRESEVLRLIAQGFSEIASRLNISIETVEANKAGAVENLGLFTRADLVRYGVALG